jgi:GntR family transcriptional repressor for pyruvate dehydrogenase complex
MKEIKRVSLVDETTRMLIKDIDSTRFNIGDKMPSEAVLCKDYKVSRITIREALRILQALGYVELIQHRGFFVLNKKIDSNSDSKRWMMAHAREILDVLEVRSVIEPFAASLAAKRAKDEEIYTIMGLKALFEEVSKNEDHVAMSVYDEKFHEMIITSTRNTFLKGINEVINEALRNFRSKTFTIDKRGEKAIDAHAKIIAAIRDRDSSKAEEAMYSHVKSNIEIVKEYLDKQENKE